MQTGIVLGGGGTLGDFQVGALIFLYKKGILPDIKCVFGTSIGAINAVIVSTGAGCDQMLENYWSKNVIGREDLIPQHKWSENVAPILKAFMESEKRLNISCGRQINLTGPIRAISALVQKLKENSLRDTISGIDDLEAMIRSALRDSTLYTAEKLKQRMLDWIDDKKALDRAIVFGLFATNVETGQKTCFTNSKQLSGVVDDTLYVPCQSSGMLIQAALASSAVPVVFPPVDVCGNYYIDGGAREVVPVNGAIKSDADTIYAILCLPRLSQRRKRKYAFLDVKGEDMYWQTSNLFDVRPEDWVVNNRNWDPKSEECDVLDIANRTAAILLDELTEGDLTSTDCTGKKIEPIVIDPLIPVHGWTQLNIGLLKINADQGYMRAFDVVCAYSVSNSLYEQCEQLTAEITSERIKIWTLEHRLIEEWSKVRDKSTSAVRYLWDVPYAWRVAHHLCANVVDTTILCVIRQKKKELKAYIDKRLAFVQSSSLSDDDKKSSLPDDYVKMYLCWEPHDWHREGGSNKPLIPTPWDELDLGKWGSDVIEEDWSVGRPPDHCDRRSLLRYLGTKSR
jgi:predicted acylesterase/phospholipase RssA